MPAPTLAPWLITMPACRETGKAYGIPCVTPMSAAAERNIALETAIMSSEQSVQVIVWPRRVQAEGRVASGRRMPATYDNSDETSCDETASYGKACSFAVIYGQKLD